MVAKLLPLRVFSRLYGGKAFVPVFVLANTVPGIRVVAVYGSCISIALSVTYLASRYR